MSRMRVKFASDSKVLFTRVFPNIQIKDMGDEGYVFYISDKEVFNKLFNEHFRHVKGSPHCLEEIWRKERCPVFAKEL